MARLFYIKISAIDKMIRKPKKSLRKKPITRRTTKFGSQASGASDLEGDYSSTADTRNRDVGGALPTTQQADGSLTTTEYEGSTEITGGAAIPGGSVGFSTAGKRDDEPLGTGGGLDAILAPAAASPDALVQTVTQTDNPELLDVVRDLVQVVARDAATEVGGAGGAGGSQASSSVASEVVSRTSSTTRRLEGNLLALYHIMGGNAGTGPLSQGQRSAIINSLIVYGNPKHNGGENFTRPSFRIPEGGTMLARLGGAWTDTATWTTQNLTTLKARAAAYLLGPQGEFNTEQVKQRSLYFMKTLVEEANITRARLMGKDTTIQRAVILAKSLEISSNIRADIEQLDSHVTGVKRTLGITPGRGPQSIAEVLVSRGMNDDELSRTLCRYHYVGRKIQLAKKFLNICTVFATSSSNLLTQGGRSREAGIYYGICSEIFNMRRPTPGNALTAITPGTPYQVAALCAAALVSLNLEPPYDTFERGRAIYEIINAYNLLISEVGIGTNQPTIFVQKYNSAGVFTELAEITLKHRVIVNSNKIAFDLIKKIRDFVTKKRGANPDTRANFIARINLDRQSGIHPFYNLIELLWGATAATPETDIQMNVACSLLLGQIQLFPVSNADSPRLMDELNRVTTLIQEETTEPIEWSELQKYWNSMFLTSLNLTGAYAEARALGMMLQQLPQVKNTLVAVMGTIGGPALRYMKEGAKAVWRAKGLPGADSLEYATMAFALFTTLASYHARNRRAMRDRQAPRDEPQVPGAAGGAGAFLTNMHERIDLSIRAALENNDSPNRSRATHVSGIRELLLSQAHTINTGAGPGEAPTPPQRAVIVLTHIGIYPACILRAEQLLSGAAATAAAGADTMFTAAFTPAENGFNNIWGMAAPRNREQMGFMAHITFLLAPVASEAMETLTSVMLRLARMATPDAPPDRAAAAEPGPDVAEAGGLDAEGGTGAVQRTVFGKLMKALRKYDEFIVLPKKNKQRPRLTTKFGSKQLLDDKKGLYVKANNKKWYLYKW